jgi:hypothetical protein
MNRSLWLLPAAAVLFVCLFVPAVPIAQLYPQLAYDAKAGILAGFLG